MIYPVYSPIFPISIYPASIGDHVSPNAFKIMVTISARVARSVGRNVADAVGIALAFARASIYLQLSPSEIFTSEKTSPLHVGVGAIAPIFAEMTASSPRVIFSLSLYPVLVSSVLIILFEASTSAYGKY